MTEGEPRYTAPAAPPAEAVAAPLSDEALAVGRDSESFMKLYQRHWRSVYAYAYARLGSKADAEDITSIVFEKAWLRLDTFRATGEFKSWLFSIARHTLADHHRGQQPAPRLSEHAVEPAADETSDPEAYALRRERWRLIVQLLRSLKPEQQDVLTLRYLVGLSFGAIARVLDKREATVKMTAYRALKELRGRYPDALE